MNQSTRDDVVTVGESCGARLREARQQAGLSLEEAGSRLHMPAAAVRALEEDDWQRAGAPIFVRGQLRSYARLLGVELDPRQLEAGLRGLEPPPLVSHTHVPKYRRLFEQATRRAVYIAITAVIAVPVWVATRPHQATDVQVRSLDVGTEAGSVATPEPVPSLAAGERTPVVASIGGLRARTRPAEAPGAADPAAGTAPALVLSFSGDSWMQVSGPDGGVVEQALLGEGEQRSYRAGEVGGVVLGNASAVEVRAAGQVLDLADFTRANVARFALSSDGSLQPHAD